MKLKGDHDTALQEVKIESLLLKNEIDKLKAQVDTIIQKKISRLEASLTLAKKANDNLGKEHTTL